MTYNPPSGTKSIVKESRKFELARLKKKMKKKKENILAVW